MNRNTVEFSNETSPFRISNGPDALSIKFRNKRTAMRYLLTPWGRKYFHQILDSHKQIVLRSPESYSPEYRKTLRRWLRVVG